VCFFPFFERNFTKSPPSSEAASSRSIDGRDAELLSNRNEGASKQSKAKQKQGLDFQRLLVTKLQVSNSSGSNNHFFKLKKYTHS
jgi:hypothetical protein